MLALEPQAAVLGQGKLSQHSCSCLVLGGILWREWLLLAGAELQGGWESSQHPPGQLCSQLAAGQRGRVALRAWAPRRGGTPSAGLGGPGFADASGSRGGAGLAAGLVQTGRRSDVPRRVVWLTRQWRRSLGRTRFRSFHRWFHKGFSRARAHGESLPVLIRAGSGRPQTDTLLKWVLVLPKVSGFVETPNACCCGVSCAEHGWALLDILGLVRAQDCVPEGAAGNRTRRSKGAGEDGGCSSVPSPLPACRVSSGTSILAALPCPQAVPPAPGLLLLHGEIKHFDFVS